MTHIYAWDLVSICQTKSKIEEAEQQYKKDGLITSIRESRDEYHAKQLNFNIPFYELRVKEQPEWISLA